MTLFSKMISRFHDMYGFQLLKNKVTGGNTSILQKYQTHNKLSKPALSELF